MVKSKKEERLRAFLNALTEFSAFSQYVSYHNQKISNSLKERITQQLVRKC